MAKDRRLPELGRGDILAFLEARAYGFSMASQYNGQPRRAEVLVCGGEAKLTRSAEDTSALLAGTEDSDSSDEALYYAAASAGTVAAVLTLPALALDPADSSGEALRR